MAEKDRIRTKQIHIKLSDEEFSILKNKAEKAELSASEVIRILIVYGHIKPKKFEEKSQKVLEDLRDYLKKRTYEINRIGNNINQIAWNTNGRFQTEESELIDAKKNVEDLQEVFMEDMNFLGSVIAYANDSDS